MEDNLCYRAKYSKTDKTPCRGCKNKIGKDTLKLAVVQQSQKYRRKFTYWYHQPCFFGKQRPTTVGDIQDFETLRWEDKENIKEKIKNLDSTIVAEPKRNGEKRAITSKFRVEVAKSGRVQCHGCVQKILKDELRIVQRLNSQGQQMWHLNCFAQQCTELCFTTGGDSLQGYYNLNQIHQDEVKQLLPINQDEPNAKKIKKTEDEVDENANNPPIKSKKIKKREQLKETLSKKDLQSILKAIPDDKTILDHKDKNAIPKKKVSKLKPPLDNLEFVLFNVSDKDKLEGNIRELGGRIVTEINKTVMAVISNQESFGKMGMEMTNAKNANVFIVPEDFVGKASKKKCDEIFHIIEEMSICDWGLHPSKRTREKTPPPSPILKESIPSSIIAKLEDEPAVDFESGLDDCAHVYTDGDVTYNAVLVDFDNQRNSFFKLQLLQANKANIVWVFRAWGFLGTTANGGNKLEKMANVTEAIKHFCDLYLEKSGNEWDTRYDFHKVPGKMYPI